MTSVAETPAVSVIMTVYNGEQYLAQALDSIRRQSLSQFEFVIVDDGSEDRTPEILVEAQVADPRIRVISMPRLGRAPALNVAWTHANGLYIANLDADDMAEPNRLERQLAFLQHHPEVGLVGTASRVFYEDTGKEMVRRPPTSDPELRRALVRYNPFQHSSVMMRRHVLEEVGGYTEDLSGWEDFDLWVRIGCHYRLANLADVLIARRIHRRSNFSRIAHWKRYKSLTEIRWRAWRRFRLPLTDIRFIIHPHRLPLTFIANKFPKFAALYRRLKVRMKKDKLGT